MVEIYATIGGSSESSRHVSEDTDRLEPLIETPPLSVLAPRETHWIDTARMGALTAVVVGDLFDLQSDSGTYRSIDTDRNSEFVLKEYQRQGERVFERLNGEYLIILMDSEDETATIVTDRLGSLPAFKHHGNDGVLRITTNLQLFAFDPSVRLQYHPQYLAEFFVFQRVFGVHTPLKRVRKFSPSSISRYDIGRDELSRRSYWRPVYDPDEKPYGRFVDEFSDLITTVINERVGGKDDIGLLLSGGSDSRLIARLVQSGDRSLTAYHMNEVWNKEARTAQQIAERVGAEFEFLHRDDGYYPRVLQENSDYENYLGWFNTDHAGGFKEQLSDHELTITGLFADIFFRGYYIPKEMVPVPGLDKSLKLPQEYSIDTLEEFAEYRVQEMGFNDEIPPYFESDLSIEEILLENLSMDGDAIVDHGVRYPSLHSAIFSYYPLTNDYMRFYQGLLQAGPRWSPFLDNRLIDLQLRYPIRYMLKHNIVNDAIAQIDPDLLQIQHPDSGLALNRPRALHLFTRYGRSFHERVSRKAKRILNADSSHGTPGSWPNYQTLFTNTDVFEEYIRSPETDDILRNVEMIDGRAMRACYESEPRFEHFYPLFSLLENPIGKSITAEAKLENDVEIAREHETR